MIYSMTGFGRATTTINEVSFSIEIKSLNSKQLDLNVRMPSYLKEKEIALRKILSEALERGKVEVFITSEKGDDVNSYIINKELVANYMQQINALKEDLKVDAPDVLNAILKLPNVLLSAETKVEETDFENLINATNEAIEKLNEFRAQEGKALYEDFLNRVSVIFELSKTIEKTAPLRIEKIRERILQNLESIAGNVQTDNDRFEQEMIYYLEKLDITEEIVRLSNHCKYFEETLKNEDVSKGKKLSFIVQEMGREINTIGSKANDVDIQKNVVIMKDELEKIKEQLSNVL